MGRNLLALKPMGTLRHSYSSTNVTTAAWVQLTASIPSAATAIQVFDSSGSVMELAVGAASSEVSLNYYIVPGGSDTLLPFNISKATRLAAKAVDANATAGQLVINFFG